MIKIGVIGTGFGARVHVPAFQLDQRVRVVALAGRNSDRLREYSDIYGIPKTYTKWEDLLKDKDIDAVSIALPPGEQAKVLPAVYASGKHVLAEKPIGLGFQKTYMLAHEFDRKRLIHAVDFEFPLLPAWQTFFSLLKQGKAGEIQHLKLNWHVQTTAYSQTNSWKTDVKSGGGTLSNLACHSLHYVEWIMGPAVRLLAHLGRDEIHTDIILEFEGGKKASLSVSMNTPFGHGHRLDLYGTNATLTLENKTADYMNGFVLITKDKNGEQKKDFPPDTRFKDGRISAVHRIVKLFIDSIEAKKLLAPNLHDGVRNEQLIECARLSHQKGTIIDI